MHNPSKRKAQHKTCTRAVHNSTFLSPDVGPLRKHFPFPESRCQPSRAASHDLRLPAPILGCLAPSVTSQSLSYEGYETGEEEREDVASSHPLVRNFKPGENPASYAVPSQRICSRRPLLLLRGFYLTVQCSS